MSCRLAVVSFVLGLVLAAGPAAAEGKPNPHAARIKGPFKSGPEVTAVCLKCHAKQAEDLMKSSHWKWKGPPRSLEGFGPGSKDELGKLTLINNFCISIEGGAKPSNREKCSQCHPSYGWLDGSFDFTDRKAIDCLVCHAQEGMYQKSYGGFPDPRMLANGRMDLVKAARSVSAPTRGNCLTCHAYGGSGECVKHGDLGSSLESPDDDLDVHMGQSQGLNCQDCHRTEAHNISGQSVFTATYSERVTCRDCHGESHAKAVQKDALNRHLRTLACETCHLPVYARDVATQMSWDWSSAGKSIVSTESYDRESYSKDHGLFTWGKDVNPTYAWFNGTIRRYLKGQKLEGTSPYVLNRPLGDLADPRALIYPFKRHSGRQPMDSKFRYLLTPNTFKGYWEHYDWQRALKDGVAGSGLAYSGAFEFVDTVEYSGLHHMIPPKANALKCGDCHDGGKRLDWRELGYAGDPKKVGARKLPAAKEEAPQK